VTFNGNSFDLPVLRYRALVNRIAAPGLSMRPYFNRYTEDAIDLCDVLSAFSSQGKATLNEICRTLGSDRTAPVRRVRASSARSPVSPCPLLSS
jgi:3'-5' exonuclease